MTLSPRRLEAASRAPAGRTFSAGRAQAAPGPCLALRASEDPRRPAPAPAALAAALCLLAAALLSWPAALSAGVQVVVPADNSVTGPRILLGDIANVAPDSDSEEDSSLAALLSAADLGPSPLPGQKLTLRRQQLEARLVESGAPVNDARWIIPQQVTLTGGGTAPDRDLLRRIVTEHLDRFEPWASGRWELLHVTSPSPPALPEGEVTWRFSPQPSSNPNYLSGTVYFTVNGQDAGRVRVTAQIDLQVPALVAARDLPRGHVLGEEDLSESYVPFARAKGALTDAAQGAGQTLKTSVRAGAPVRDRDLVRTAMVSKGETVTIIAQSGGLKVTALGQAREEGALGQTISVMNQDSKKVISAKVIGPGQVEVVF
ncbi:MAG: flagellar basal body P-ring formation chaperone FlgA [Deltaproteobacteria bacterium]|nr:flagellar basal body P-ring formation chaperone FlgA [Deltaproteobacteria bacterium]